MVQTILISMLSRPAYRPETTEARDAIAEKLRLVGRTVPATLPCWVARVEYTLSTKLTDLERIPARAASVVVNRLGLHDVVTVKYPGRQTDVRTDGIAAASATVRRALEAISTAARAFVPASAEGRHLPAWVLGLPPAR